MNILAKVTLPIARVFEEAGWIGRDAILMTGINAVIYVLSTIPPSVSPYFRIALCSTVRRWYLVDRWGRRIILLTGAIVVCIFSSLPSSIVIEMRFRWALRSQ